MTVAKKTEEPPYARLAFLNPYNLSLFAGGVVGGWLSGHTWLVVVTCALEALWMIFAPDSRVLRAVWFDPARAAGLAAEKLERRQAKFAKLAPMDGARVLHLAEQKESIERLAKDNPSLAVDLLGDELAKLDGLVEEFADLGLVASRAEAHAATFDFEAMRRSHGIHERQAKAFGPGDPRREIAERNLEVLRQRRRRWDDLSRTIQVTRGQMELIEQTFRLLADEIISMASPRELGGRIEELRVAVEAVRETTDEAEGWGSADELELVDDEKRTGS